MKTERGATSPAREVELEPRTPQRAIFARSEGDRYFARNRREYEGTPRSADELLDAMERHGSLPERVAPARVLEVGAANGWRLALLRERRPGVRAVAVDPSAAALVDGRTRHPGVASARATADRLPFVDGTFDWILFGFCLYLCDRDDLFRIAAEADRVLAPEGSIGIVDFVAGEPHATPYAHAPGAYSYKMDHASMFTWNPVYRRVHHATRPYDASGDLLAVTVLSRRPASAFPVRDRG